jgi:hypothetical protein
LRASDYRAKRIHRKYNPAIYSVASSMLTAMQAKEGKLAYNDRNTFYADHVPSKRTQSVVYASQGQRSIEIAISWAGK